MGSRMSIGLVAPRWALAAVIAAAVMSGMVLDSASASASAPTVSNVAPATGPVSGGTELHIGGTGFSGATEVRFGSTPATFDVKSAVRIDAIAPPGEEGTVDVTVTTPEGTSEIRRGDHYSYVPPGPAVVEVRPDEGKAAGGGAATIFGAHFEAVLGVSFGAAVASYEVLSPEQIDVTVPQGEAPTLDVRVTTMEGLSPIWPGDEYHYTVNTPEVSDVSPKLGRAAGGNTVTITGEEFYGVTGVDFGTVEAPSFIVDSPTSITALAPPHAVEKIKITVLTNFGPSAPEYCRKNKGRRTKCTPAGYYKFKEPTVTGLTPESGPTGGGTPITVTGTGFQVGATGTEILIGKGVATSVECTSTTTCTALTPAAAKAAKSYVKVTIHSNEKGKSKKNPAVAFQYE